MTLQLRKRTSWIIALGSCALLLAVAVPMTLSSAPAEAKTSAEEFSMVGTWTGRNEQMMSTGTYGSGTSTLTVTDASGLTFTGTMSWSTPQSEGSDPLVGAFSPGGSLI